MWRYSTGMTLQIGNPFHNGKIHFSLLDRVKMSLENAFNINKIFFN